MKNLLDEWAEETPEDFAATRKELKAARKAAQWLFEALLEVTHNADHGDTQRVGGQLHDDLHVLIFGQEV